MSKLSFTSQEYYDLIKNLVDQQYQDSSYSENDNVIPEEAWIPAESQKKNKPRNEVVNLTNTKSDKIRDLIGKSDAIKVGEFLIKIIAINYCKQNTFDFKIDICIYEEKEYAQNGTPCKILHKLDSTKDIRFSQCKWNLHFNQFKCGKSITQDVMVNIIRWLQALHKLTAFT